MFYVAFGCWSWLSETFLDISSVAWVHLSGTGYSLGFLCSSVGKESFQPWAGVLGEGQMVIRSQYSLIL